jgi:hypothetical protein
MIFITLSSALFIGLLVVLLALARHFSTPPRLPVTVSWITDLSIDRYRPMLHLLNEKELRYLRTQPGFTPKLETALRIERVKSFRGYLRNLDDDFKRICSALKVLMVQSKHDRPDLAAALMLSQMKFALGMMTMQLQLVHYRYGARTVDAAALMALFDGMRIELRTLVPAALGAGA